MRPMVQAHSLPQLPHLKDVVVLPQTGDRDVARMCSGGDPDGDDFLAIWDHDLLPSERNVEPMDYSRPYIPRILGSYLKPVTETWLVCVLGVIQMVTIFWPFGTTTFCQANETWSRWTTLGHLYQSLVIRSM